MRDESFLDALGQEVSESIDLSFGLFGDRDMRVASSPDLLVPVGQPTDLSGEVAADVAHESGQLVGVLGGDNQVVVIRQEDEGVNRHVEELLGSPEDSVDDLAQLGRGPEQESPLEGPLRDLHGETRRDMTEAARHAGTRTDCGGWIFVSKRVASHDGGPAARGQSIAPRCLPRSLLAADVCHLAARLGRLQHTDDLRLRGSTHPRAVLRWAG